MKFLLRSFVSIAVCAFGWAATTPRAKPNIVFVMSDDVGYGDLGCYGATRVKTPNLDQLAREGARFTDQHSPAAMCTPARYTFFTGQYAFRLPGMGVASGNAPLLIPPGTPTVASVLKQAGYNTALVGKWHLGLGHIESDFNGELKPGPLELGFDYAFFIPATGDRVPCVYVENHRVVGLDPQDPIRVKYGAPIGNQPTGRTHPELQKIKGDANHAGTIVNGIARIGHMTGGKSALWNDEEIADTLARRAVAFIEKQNSNTPFFLYLAPHDIHEPIVPHPRFRGTSDCGSRGDVIHELDWTVGEVLNALDRRGLKENTLVIFTSDNGGGITKAYDDGTNALHSRQSPNGALRGRKGELYEGGHRVPFIARWPGRIPARAESTALFYHGDMIATFAALTGQELPRGGGPDSTNVLPALLAQKGAKGRDELVLQTSRGKTALVLRAGPWKLIARNDATPQLFNLESDLHETRDLAIEQPERVAKMLERLAALRDGVDRSTHLSDHAP